MAKGRETGDRIPPLSRGWLMSTIEWARRRYAWKVRIAAWRERGASVWRSISRIPKSLIAIGMLLLGSVIGAVGPFLLQEHARTRSDARQREELLDSLVEQSAATEEIVKRYAQALDVHASYRVQTQLHELSIREDARIGMISPAEADRELDRVAVQAEEANLRFEEVRKRHDEQIDRFSGWHVAALLQFKRRFPSHAKRADAAFRLASANLAAYRTVASDRAIAYEIVAALHEDSLRAAFLDYRARRISEHEYRLQIAQSGETTVGSKTGRLVLDLSALRNLAAIAQKDIAE